MQELNLPGDGFSSTRLPDINELKFIVECVAQPLSELGLSQLADIPGIEKILLLVLNKLSDPLLLGKGMVNTLS